MKKWIFVLACTAIMVLALSPVEHLAAPVFQLWDKAQHALAFAGLMALGLWAYPHARLRLALGLLLYGVTMELTQAASGWRHAEWADLLADMLGIVTALGICHAATSLPCARKRH